MLDIKFIRENAKLVKQAVKNRNKKADVDHLLELDKERRALIVEIDAKRSEQKSLSAVIARSPKGDAAIPSKLKKLKEEIKTLE